MRINCEVTVVSRALVGTNCRQPRAVRASLGVGRAALGDNGSICLHLCTATNRHGSKYKIVKNIDGVFTKFMHEGKFTIRLKEPKLDLIVKTDAVQAKSFLQLLKSCLSGAVPASLSSLTPVKVTQLARPKTSLVVTTRECYPVAASFSPSLLHLFVNGCQLSRVDGRILRLRRLQTLDLGLNNITELPHGLTHMAALTELSLPSNRLARLPAHIFAGSIGASLRKLDLRNNQLQLLPASVCLLKKLVTLDVSLNKLQSLPFTLGRLSHLKYLVVSDNLLHALPQRLSGTNFTHLDLADACRDKRCTPDYVNLPTVLPLHELAGRALLRSCGEDLSCLDSLPATLRRRLTYHVRCNHCSSPILQFSAIYVVWDWDREVSKTLFTSGSYCFPRALLSCSWECYNSRHLVAAPWSW